jgi:cytoskeletal protein CcmA (bactofilin family)
MAKPALYGTSAPGSVTCYTRTRRRRVARVTLNANLGLTIHSENRLPRCSRLSILFCSGLDAPSEARRGRLLAGAATARWSLKNMWKRKEDEYTTPHEPNSPGSSSMPAAPAPPRSAEPVRTDALRSGEVATIGKSVVVKGELSGSEDLILDGEVEGSITLRGQSLTVGPNGRVRANIEARNVIVHGRVDGNIHATDRVELRKSASHTGDISTARISIEDGAFFKGGIDIQKPEPAGKAEPRPAASPAATPPPAPISAQGTLLEPKKL